MTVWNEQSKSAPVTANGTDVEFSFDFYIEEAAWLHVYTEINDIQTELNGTEYTISPDAIQNVDGGRVTFDSAPVVGTSIVFSREPPGTQEQDLENIGVWSRELEEKALDKLTYLLNHLAEQISRAILSPITGDPIDLSELLAAILAAEGYALQAKDYRNGAEDWYYLTLGLLESNGLLFGGTKIITFGMSPYTIVNADKNFILACDTTGGSIVILAPSIAVGGEPYVYAIRKDTPDANIITLNRNGSDTINDLAENFIVAAFKEFVTFFADEDAAPDNWGIVRLGVQAGDVFWDGFVAAGLSNPDGFDTFTPGTTSSLTMSQDPGAESNVQVFFDGAMVAPNRYERDTVTILFTDGSVPTAIPIGVREVWIRVGTDLPIGVPGTGLSGPILLATGSILVGLAGVAAALDAKTSGNLLLGNGTTLRSVAMSGDGTIDEDGVLTVTGVGGGANPALSNLAGVAINTTLVSDTDNTDDLGTSGVKWKDLYLAGNAVVGGTVDGRDVSVDGTKLDTIETGADVTDAANVAAAGALMDVANSVSETNLQDGAVGLVKMGLVAREETIQIDVSGDLTTPCVAGVKKYEFRMPFDFVPVSVGASLSIANTSAGPFTIDINEGGVSVLSTKLTIDDNELTSATAATSAVISDVAWAVDAIITIDWDNCGTSGLAAGNKVWILGYRTSY